jgi:EmrB/QacA subfamily drug resistance transporter
MLDTTIMNTALPSIARDLGETPIGMQSVIICYMLSVAFFMPTSGWMADKFGIRKVFVFANLMFTLGSFLCALAPSLGALVVARIIQGAGGAFLMPVGRLIVMRVYPRSRLTEVLSFISMPALLGPLLGPTVGGFLAEYASWHWIFLINIPVGISAAIISSHLIPNLKMPDVGRFDTTGFIFVGVAVLSLTIAIESSTDLHLPIMYSLPTTALGLGALFAYITYARRAKSPLFNLGVFHVRSYSVGILGNIFARLASGAMPFMTPLLLQVALGYSPSQAGLLMMPTALMSIAGKRLVNKLLGVFGYRNFLVVNTILLGIMMSLFSLFNADTPLWQIILQFCIFGLINSMQFTAMFTMTLVDLPPEYASGGNSILSVITQLSMGMGVGIGASLLVFFHGGLDTSVSIAAFHGTYLSIGIINILATIIFTFTPRNAGR